MRVLGRISAAALAASAPRAAFAVRVRLALPAAALVALVMAGCGGGEPGRGLGRVDPGAATALRASANEICRDAGDPLAALDSEDLTWSDAVDAAVAERKIADALTELDVPRGMRARWDRFVEVRRERVEIARTVADSLDPSAGGGVTNFLQIFVEDPGEHARLAADLGLDDCAP